MYSCPCNSFYTLLHFADTFIYAIMSTRNKHCRDVMLCVCIFEKVRRMIYGRNATCKSQKSV